MKDRAALVVFGAMLVIVPHCLPPRANHQRSGLTPGTLEAREIVVKDERGRRALHLETRVEGAVIEIANREGQWPVVASDTRILDVQLGIYESESHVIAGGSGWDWSLSHGLEIKDGDGRARLRIGGQNRYRSYELEFVNDYLPESTVRVTEYDRGRPVQVFLHEGKD